MHLQYLCLFFFFSFICLFCCCCILAFCHVDIDICIYSTCAVFDRQVDFDVDNMQCCELVDLYRVWCYVRVTIIPSDFLFNPKQTLHIRLPLSPVSPVVARLNMPTFSLLPVNSGCIAWQPVCLGGAGPTGTRFDCSSSTIQAKLLLGQRLHRCCLRTIYGTTMAMKRQWEIKYEKGQKTDTTAWTLTEHSCMPKQWPYFFFWI